MRTVLFVAYALLFMASLLPAQQEDLELEIGVGGSIPLFPTLENGQELYHIGPSIQGSALYPLDAESGMWVGGKIGYLHSNTYADKPFSLLSLAPGLEFRHTFSRFVISASGFGGVYMGLFDGQSAGDIMFQGGPALRFLLTPSITLNLSVDYTHFSADIFRRALYSGLRFSLGSNYAIANGQSNPVIEYGDTYFSPIFPVFHAYYDDHPIGKLTLENSGSIDIQELKVEFYTPEFMDSPKECLTLEHFPAGAEVEAPLYGLFNRKILATTEGTKVPAEISISFRYIGQQRSRSLSKALIVRNRNAMTWDDDRKAASFVTARDEDVLRFAKSTASFVRDSRSRIINRTFRIAMGMFRALEQYGLRYVIDPTTPYESFSEDETAVDYLQFPAQTLSFGGGDCDDLSILYAALLEAVGIETGFITVPGHIYLAFNAEIPREETEHAFKNRDDVILHNGKCWIPVEVTMLNESFLSAWREGARKWRQYSPEGHARLLPVRSAWEMYEPVDRPPLNARVTSFEPSTMKKSYERDLEQMTSFQIQDRIYELKNRIAREGDDQEVFVNKLGVLYARYGLFDSARREFARAAARDYFPALINLGNIHYLEGAYREALALYQQALELRKESSLAQLGVARSQYELENYRAAELAYLRARESEPATAARFSYLASTGGDSKTRAADGEAREEAMVWGY